jgi:serine/threonine protein kinase
LSRTDIIATFATNVSLTAGTRIGPYEITGSLGAGGMGEVYRARDRKLSRDVALKMLPELFARDPDRLARFEREATVLASLNHPNIAAIYGFEESPAEAGHRVRALVLELVEGETLADRITRGPVPLDEALPIARQICEALEAAHEHGVVHRDLKPANIKLRPDGMVKVLDFGLAKALEPEAVTRDVTLSPTITSPAAERLNLAGGAPQELASALQGRGGTWSADDVIVYGATATGGLMQVPARGGTPMPATRLSAGQGSHRWPQFLPDGRRFIFSASLGRPEARGVFVASLDGGESRRILAVDTSAMYAPPGLLLYVSNDVLVAQRFDESADVVTGDPEPVAQGVGTEEGMWRGGFSVSRTGVIAHRAGAGSRRILQWMDRSGKVLRTTKLGADVSLATIAHPAISPDGRYVALAVTSQGNPDIWLVTIDSGVTSRFTTDPTVDFSPLWKPDGTTIVFRSSRSGPFDLFEKPADSAGNERLLLTTPENKSPTDWSKDGRVLLYTVADPKTASDLWALPMTEPADARKPFPVLQTSFDEIQGQFSPDGHWITYVSNESGRYDVYVKPFPDAGGRFPVSAAGGTNPRWRRDGKELFYVADNQLMAVPIRPGRDARTLTAGAPLALFATHLALGGNLPAGGYNSGAQYTVTSDGQFLMNVTANDAVTSPITLVLNWTAALRKRP